jgi:hypothetical protein
MAALRALTELVAWLNRTSDKRLIPSTSNPTNPIHTKPMHQTWENPMPKLVQGMGLQAVALLALMISCAAANSRNQVTSLPGYGAPPSNHWSGFVQVDEEDGANW